MKSILAFLLSASLVGCATGQLSDIKSTTGLTKNIEAIYLSDNIDTSKKYADYNSALSRSTAIAGFSYTDHIRVRLLTVPLLSMKDRAGIKRDLLKKGKTESEVSAAMNEAAEIEINSFTKNKTCVELQYIAASYEGVHEGLNAEYWGHKIIANGKEYKTNLVISPYRVETRQQMRDTVTGFTSTSSTVAQQEIVGMICTETKVPLENGVTLELHPRFILPKAKPFLFVWGLKAAPAK